MTRRTLRSDNNAGLTPEALAALASANDGHAVGYGDDAWTERAIDAFRGIFGERIHVFFVATGTAANTLAVAALTEPWQRVLCHAHSHWNDDESTAPERLTTCRTTAIHVPEAKLTPADVHRAGGSGRGDVHQPAPGVLTISNATEFGTVYTPGETRALVDAARAGSYRVHVDGARFANAVASLGCEPNELAGAAGIDALSFGGTKNGLAFGEAVVFFEQGDGSIARRAAERFPFLRKGTGHLLSKHRFASAPFAATLTDGSWLRHASHANEMARRLARGLASLGYETPFPTEANGVFVRLPETVEARLRERGHEFYPFESPRGRLARLMCAWDTAAEEVDRFLADAAGD